MIIGSHTVEETHLHDLAAELGLQPSRAKVHSGHRYPAPLRAAPFTYMTQAGLGESGAEYRQWLVFHHSRSWP